MNLDHEVVSHLVNVTVEKLKVQLSESKGLEPRVSVTIGEVMILLAAAFEEKAEKYMETRVFAQATGVAIALPRPETSDVNSTEFDWFVRDRIRDMLEDCAYLISVAEEQEDAQDT